MQCLADFGFGPESRPFLAKPVRPLSCSHSVGHVQQLPGAWNSWLVWSVLQPSTIQPLSAFQARTIHVVGEFTRPQFRHTAGRYISNIMQHLRTLSS